jgi:hypothetical protein
MKELKMGWRTTVNNYSYFLSMKKHAIIFPEEFKRSIKNIGQGIWHPDPKPNCDFISLQR